MELLSISQASVLLEVSEKTLRAWDSNGKLVAIKTEGGHRRYDVHTINAFARTLNKDVEIDFLESDLYEEPKERHTKQIEFWKRKGYVKTESDEPLAILLTNLMSYFTTRTHHVDKQFLIDVLVSFWHNDATKHLVNWTPLLGPTGLIYYMRQHQKEDSPDGTKNIDLSIESEVVAAVTKVLEFKYKQPSKTTITVLDPNTFEPSQKDIINGFSHLTKDEVKEFVTRKANREIAKLIINDLSATAKVLDCPIEHFFGAMDRPPVCIAAGEVGIKVLNKTCGHWGFNCDKIETPLETYVVGHIGDAKVKVVYTPDLDDEIIISSQNKYTSSYFFCPYIMFMEAAEIDGDPRLMAKYAKKSVDNNMTILGKIIL